MGKRKYPLALINKYSDIMGELERHFVEPTSIVTFDFSTFFRENKMSSALLTMFLRRGYIEKIGKNSYKVLKAHPFQSMARNPEEALNLVTEYNLTCKLAREDKARREQLGINAPIPEPEIVETPFEELTEVPPELTAEELIEVPPELTEEEIQHSLNIIAEDIALRAKKRANARRTELHKFIVESFKGFKGLIRLGNYQPTSVSNLFSYGSMTGEDLERAIYLDCVRIEQVEYLKGRCDGNQD